MRLARSLALFAPAASVHLHVLAPQPALATAKQLIALDGARESGLAKFTMYDDRLCEEHTRTLGAFADTSTVATACALVLHDVLPALSGKALVLSERTFLASTAPAALSRCLEAADDDATLWAAVAQGDKCSLDPDDCWPAPHLYITPENTTCGDVPAHYRESKYADGGAPCFRAYEPQPAFLDGGK